MQRSDAKVGCVSQPFPTLFYETEVSRLGNQTTLEILLSLPPQSGSEDLISDSRAYVTSLLPAESALGPFWPVVSVGSPVLPQEQ